MNVAETLGGRFTGQHRTVLVLLNPAAGQGRHAARIQRHLAEYASPDLKLIVPDPTDHQEQLRQAHEIIGAGADAVVIFGGDGMVHAAVQLLAGTQVPLGVVPTGTGNDFARGAGIARRATIKTLRNLLHHLGQPELATAEVDALRVRITAAGQPPQECWAANSVNIGFDARVNQRANQLRAVPGPLRYLTALAQTVPSFRPIPFSITVDGENAERRDSALVCLQNGPFIGGGIPLAPGARADDGLLDLSVVQPLSRPGLVALFPLLMLRGHSMLRPLKTDQHQRVLVDVPPQVPIYADGDELVAGADRQCQVEVLLQPRALRLLG